MRAILDAVSPAATLVEALEPRARGSAGLRRAARHRRHARADRAPRRRRARAAGHAHAADRDREALRPRRLRQRPARQLRAPDRRDRHDRLRRQPRRRTAAPGATRPQIDPRARRAGRARARSSPRASTAPSCSASACATRTRTRSPPSTGAARPTRSAPTQAVREIAAPAEREGFAVHWGRKVLEVRPPVMLDKGLGIATLLAGELDAGGAVRRRRHHRPRRLPRAARARAGGLAGARDLRRRDLRRGAAASSRARRTCTVDGPAGVRGLLEALL